MWLATRHHRPRPAEIRRAAVLMALSCLAGAATSAAAEEAATEVAYVENVSGRAIAFAQGRPVQLDTLDLVTERTRIDLQAASELRLCHYRTQQLFALKGPVQASISREGVTTEPGKSAVTAAGPCVAPLLTSYQGGITLRSSAIKSIDVPLRPSIKIIDRGKPPVNRIALWDGESRKILLTFSHDRAQPALDDGQSYVLVVGRSDGSDFKLRLLSKAGNASGPLIVLAR
jgi:hypothetical protein